jgi:NAD(P)H-nitrite reductase large subunit
VEPNRLATGVAPPEGYLSPVDDDIEICQCYGLSAGEIAKRIREENLRTIWDVSEALGVGRGCGACRWGPNGIARLLERIWEHETGTDDRRSSVAGHDRA